MAVTLEGTQRGGSLFQARPSGGAVYPGRSPRDLKGLGHFSFLAMCLTSTVTLMMPRW